MPTSTPEARVVGVTGNIVSVESDAPLMKNSIAFVHTGDASLKGEVLRVLGRRADSLAMNTRPSLLTTADDWGISAAVSQNGKYNHVQVITNQAQT
jgi:hypothetical protein